MVEVIFDEWSGQMTLDLRRFQVPEIKAHGRHSIVDGTSRWAVFFKADGPPMVKFAADETLRFRCDDGPWVEERYQPGGGSDHRIIGAGPAPFPSGAPAEFLLQSDTSQARPEALAPLPQDAGAMETARLHLGALRAEVDRILSTDVRSLEAGLLDGLVVELDELSDYIDGHLGIPPSQTDYPQSVTKALEFLRRAANRFYKSKATEVLRLAAEMATILQVFGVTVEFDVSQLPVV